MIINNKTSILTPYLFELAIINTSATGTGIRLQNIHIINLNPNNPLYPEEYYIADPTLIIKENITTKTDKTKVSFSGTLIWEVKNNRIYANVPAWLHDKYIGTVIIEYKYNPQNEFFNLRQIQINEISFRKEY